MKKILRLIGSLLLVAVLGLFVADPVISILTGDSPAEAFGNIFSKGFVPELLHIGWMLLALVIAFILHIVLHEGGHLVAGLLTGYKFVSFRFLNWTLIRQDGRLRWRNFELAGTAGQCLLAPPDKPLEQIDTRWYNAGGVLANIVIVVVSIVLLRAFDLPGWVDTLLGTMVAVGIIIALMNGIPMKIGGVANDGMNLLQLEKDLQAKKSFCNILDINARSQRGEPYTEMPDRLFETPEVIDWANSMHTASVMSWATRMMTQHQWEDAYEVMAEACRNKDEMMKLYQLEVENLMTQLCLISGRDDEAREHYTREVEQHVSRHAATQSDKQLTAMAAALILDGDSPRAEQIMETLEANRDRYIHQTDVATALDLMHMLLDNSIKQHEQQPTT